MCLKPRSAARRATPRSECRLSARSPSQARRPSPSSSTQSMQQLWTALQHDGPDHLGLRLIGAKEFTQQFHNAMKAYKQRHTQVSSPFCCWGCSVYCLAEDGCQTRRGGQGARLKKKLLAAGHRSRASWPCLRTQRTIRCLVAFWTRPRTSRARSTWSADVLFRRKLGAVVRETDAGCVGVDFCTFRVLIWTLS